MNNIFEILNTVLLVLVMAGYIYTSSEQEGQIRELQDRLNKLEKK